MDYRCVNTAYAGAVYFSFSLTAANRLARGSSVPPGVKVLAEEAETAPRPGLSPSDLGRLGILSPVDCRMT